MEEDIKYELEDLKSIANGAVPPELSKDEAINIINFIENLINRNKELEEQLRKANEYIRNEMYIDDNPTICGDEEDTITELPISLNLYNEGLRELLELLEERN